MRSKGSRHGNLRRYIAAPKKFLAKARDFYMKSMIEFDGKIAYGSNIMMPGIAPQVSNLPNDFGTSLKKNVINNDENLKDLCRSVYTKYVENYERERQQNQRNVNHDHRNIGGYDDFGFGFGRSCSVGLGRIGRIDEDEPCFFRQEEIIMKSEILFPTCRR